MSPSSSKSQSIDNPSTHHNTLTHGSLSIYAHAMPSMPDVIARISSRLAADAERLKDLAAEREELASAYHRYVDNQEEWVRRERSAKAALAFLGGPAVEKLTKSGTTWAGVDWVGSAANLRKAAALWEHIEQYLRIVPEAQVNEILAVMERLGIDASRPAIESAVRTHPNVFGIRKRAREKFFYRKESA